MRIVITHLFLVAFTDVVVCAWLVSGGLVSAVLLTVFPVEVCGALAAVEPVAEPVEAPHRRRQLHLVLVAGERGLEVVLGRQGTHLPIDTRMFSLGILKPVPIMALR